MPVHYAAFDYDLDHTPLWLSVTSPNTGPRSDVNELSLAVVDITYPSA